MNRNTLLLVIIMLCAAYNAMAQHAQMVRPHECISLINYENPGTRKEIFKVGNSDYNYFVDLEPDKGWEHNCVYYNIDPIKLNGQINYTKIYATRPNNGDVLTPFTTIGQADTIRADVPMASLPEGLTNSVGHLYAVILSGGGNANSNYVRYWNDCSFIYKTLRNRFGIPSENISLLISDGADPGYDMKLGNGSFVSSPQDLDGDGINEYVQAATKSNLTSVLNSLAATMTEDDRLFLYVIDHGSRSNGHSYICLWNYETISDTELDNLLDNFSVSSMNIVLGQCFSGGFINYLSAPNRVISTACAANEYSYAMYNLKYDEFVHHWTTAVNEHDVYGNRVSTDNNNDGFVAAAEAFSYAEDNDIQSETPQYSSNPNTLGASLALNEQPFSFDLYIRDNEEDTGLEPNTTTEEFWSSPDIWMRNQPDGLYGHEAIQVLSNSQRLYTYVRVTNRGERDYEGRGWYLHLFWASAAAGLTIENWGGEMNFHYTSGEPLRAKLIRDTIRVGETKTILYTWDIPEQIADSVLVSGEPFHICHLAYLSPESNTFVAIPTDSENEHLAGVLQYRAIAQVNASFVNTNVSSVQMPLIVANTDSEDREYSIEVIPCKKNTADMSKMELSIELEKPLYKIWENSGGMAEKAISYKAEPSRFYMQKYDSKITNLLIPKDYHSRLRMNCKCSIVADEDIAEETWYEYDIIQRDLKTGKIVGGEHFTIVQQPRKAIKPEIEYGLTGEGYNLKAIGVDEDAKYEWIDDDGKTLAEGKTVFVVPTASDKQIRLKVTAASDGAVNYATLSLDSHFFIAKVSPTPFRNQLTVALSSPALDNTVIRIMPVNTKGSAEEYKVKRGEKEMTMFTSGYCPGVYVVCLLADGNVIDTRSVICQ